MILAGVGRRRQVRLVKTFRRAATTPIRSVLPRVTRLPMKVDAPCYSVATPMNTVDDYTDEGARYPYASGDPDGGRDDAADGLGKKFWKTTKFKKATKPLRKAVLIAGAGAALWYGGPLVLGAAKKLFAGAPAVAASAPSGDFQPQPEYGDTTGYEGAASATVPGAPLPVAAGPLFTPGLFDSASKLAATAARVRAGSPTEQVRAQSTTSAPTGVVGSRNIMLLGAAGGLAALLYFMRRGGK